MPVSPALQLIPHRDSGVFLYIGKGILDGKIPYLDFWDHKGPLIYYINALGLYFIQDSYWGVWFVELFSLSIAAILGFSLMRDRFNASFAFLSTVAWMLAFGKALTSQFGGGNHVEEYALLFYMAQIYLFLRKRKNTANLGSFFFIGFFAALCILLRPNLISPLIAVYLVTLTEMFISKQGNRVGHFQNLLMLTFGVGLTLSMVSLYFWQRGAGYDLLHDVISYNLSYSGSDTNYLGAFVDSFRVLGVINVVGLAIWALLVFYSKKLIPNMDNQLLVRFLVVLMPIEIVLSLLSGHGYIHYFISWLPALGTLLCVSMAITRTYFENNDVLFFKRYGWAIPCIILIVQAAPLIKDLQIFFPVISDKSNSGNLFLTDGMRSPEWEDMKSLYEIAPEGTQVIFWGNEVKYNFVMNLPSPTRYIYIYPLMDSEYTTNSMKNEFLSAIKELKPVIVDIQPSSVPPVKSLAKWMRYPDVLPVIYYVKDNYHVAREINVISYYYVDNQLWTLAHKWTILVHN